MITVCASATPRFINSTTSSPNFSSFVSTLVSWPALRRSLSSRLANSRSSPACEMRMCFMSVEPMSLATVNIANRSRSRPIIAVIDWIDAAHRFLAGLFFDDMRDQSGRARDHENTVECRRIHPQIGKDRADGAVHIDWKRFFCGGERFFDGARRLNMHAVHTCFAREFEQTHSARVFRVEAVTKSRHAFARFSHHYEGARG